MSFENLIDKVIDRIQNELDSSFEVEASGRHVHLSRKELDALFGTGYELTKAKDLSQPGQYASKERLTVVGPKGAFHNVVILGPVRKESQVEVSLTDCLQLGVKAPTKRVSHQILRFLARLDGVLSFLHLKKRTLTLASADALGTVTTYNGEKIKKYIDFNYE